MPCPVHHVGAPSAVVRVKSLRKSFGISYRYPSRKANRAAQMKKAMGTAQLRIFVAMPRYRRLHGGGVTDGITRRESSSPGAAAARTASCGEATSREMACMIDGRRYDLER